MDSLSQPGGFDMGTADGISSPLGRSFTTHYEHNDDGTPALHEYPMRDGALQDMVRDPGCRSISQNNDFVRIAEYGFIRLDMCACGRPH